MTLFPIFRTLYPEGSYGGECIVFLHKFLDFRPIGDSLQSKSACVRWRGVMARDLKGDFQVGDLLITRESARYGHGAVITAIWDDDLQLTESNRFNNKRVTHGRLLNKYSPLIVGIIKVVIKNMYIRRQDGQIKEVMPDGTSQVLSYQYWVKRGQPKAPTLLDADYNAYKVTKILEDVMVRDALGSVDIVTEKM